MTIATEKSDVEIKNDVLSEFKYEPSIRITDVGVLVKDGTVTLNGYATSYGEKWAAVKTAKRVAGVRAIADDIEVKFTGSLVRSDGDIATAVINHIEWSWEIPKKTVQVVVRDGWVTLEGQVEWWYQKDAAENSVNHLGGVKGVNNMITVKPKIDAAKIEESILAAFERSALVDAGQIEVQTMGSKVTLTGKVRNHAELEEAKRIAWASPGVLSVDNQLTVDWPWFGE